MLIPIPSPGTGAGNEEEADDCRRDETRVPPLNLTPFPSRSAQPTRRSPADVAKNMAWQSPASSRHLGKLLTERRDKRVRIHEVNTGAAPKSFRESRVTADYANLHGYRLRFGGGRAVVATALCLPRRSLGAGGSPCLACSGKGSSPRRGEVTAAIRLA